MFPHSYFPANCFPDRYFPGGLLPAIADYSGRFVEWHVGARKRQPVSWQHVSKWRLKWKHPELPHVDLFDDDDDDLFRPPLFRPVQARESRAPSQRQVLAAPTPLVARHLQQHSQAIARIQRIVKTVVRRAFREFRRKLTPATPYDPLHHRVAVALAFLLERLERGLTNALSEFMLWRQRAALAAVRRTLPETLHVQEGVFDIFRTVFGRVADAASAIINRVKSIVRGAISAALIGTQLAIGPRLKVEALPAATQALVQKVENDVARTVNTGALEINTHIPMQVWQEEMGTERVNAYQLIHIPNPRQRWWHVERHGNIYYANPKPGQKGFRQMPHPPFEPDDPAERPPGTPRIAWHCYCSIVPVIV